MLDQNIQLAKTKMEQTIVFVGSELGKIRTGRANPDMFNKINVCLLYTSPSPRDATLSRMPSSA